MVRITPATCACVGTQAQAARSKQLDKNFLPGLSMKRLAYGKARVAKSAGELKRPKPCFIDNEVEVDIAAIAALVQ